MATALIVEDEPDLRELVALNARNAGFETLEAGNGADALRLARAAHPDLIVLDLMLPDMSGMEVCACIRADRDLARTPVIMLTARAAEQDRVSGFESGADDYVTKPFSNRELVLRMRALLKRTSSQPPEPVRLLRSGTVEVDEDRHEVRVGGVDVHLTALEFRLLATLIRRAGKVQSRQSLLEDVWGMSPDLQTRTVDTHVKRLRQRLGAAGDAIATVRGVGYRLGAVPTEPSEKP